MCTVWRKNYNMHHLAWKPDHYSFWDPNSDFHYFKKTFGWRLSTSRRPDCLTEILPEQLGRYRPRGPLRVFIEAEAFP